MTSRTITLLLCGILIALFAAYFAGQYAVFGSGARMDAMLGEIIQDGTSGDWSGANTAMEQLSRYWDRGKYVLMLNFAEEQIERFENNLYQLQGAVRVRDLTLTTAEATVCLEQWHNFLKIVPSP